MTALAELRGEIELALTNAVGANPWNVYESFLESPAPSCYMIVPGEPWLEGPKTSCVYTARIDVRIIAQRSTPEVGLETIERMVEAAAGELSKAQHPIRLVSPPGPYAVNNVAYLSSVIELVHTVNIGGS